jgi:hypothetical protein
MVLGLWFLVLVGFVSSSFYDVFSKAKDQKPKTYSMDILSAAAVPHGAKIKDNTVSELSK